MPYRRLPNTDQARLRAFKAAIEQAVKTGPQNLLFSQKLKLEIASYYPIFDQSVQQYLFALQTQSGISKQLGEAYRNARMYLSHYLQVYNLCVMRGEIKAETRRLLGLSASMRSIPEITSEAQLLEWGEKVIKGEENRMATGNGNRIYNPSIAVVKVKHEQFRDLYHKHKDMLATTQKHLEKVNELRSRADELILDLWNEVEASVGEMTDEARKQCVLYGVVYFYRPHEKIQMLFTGDAILD